MLQDFDFELTKKGNIAHYFLSNLYTNDGYFNFVGTNIFKAPLKGTNRVIN